jgi:quercetin dioxygenase-like cupin family protein
MEKNMRKWILGLSLVATVVLVGTAVATPILGTITAETARGGLTEPLNFNRKFDASGETSVRLKTRGDIEIVTQRIEVAPQSSFGWHSHPGDTIVVVKQGTLTLYHDESCTVGTDYGPGTAFPNRQEEVHLARNNSSTETLVVFATYFFAKKSPPVPVRVDEPSPGASCPQ